MAGVKISELPVVPAVSLETLVPVVHDGRTGVVSPAVLQAFGKGMLVTSGNTITDSAFMELSPASGLSLSVAVNLSVTGASAVLCVPANVQVSFSVHPSQGYRLWLADGVAELSGDASGRLLYSLLRAGSVVYITGHLFS